MNPRRLLPLLPLTLVGCGGEPLAVSALAMTPKGLEAAKLEVHADNPLTAEKAELGKMLFFDKRLAKDGSMACTSCHVHEKAWTDGIALSTKVDGSKNTRNSPSLYNVGYQPHYYWDGRAASLEQNIEAAWKGHMGGDPAAMAKKLAEIPGYVAAFEKAFGAAPSGQGIVHALSAFVRTLQSGGSAYDEGTMSAAARRGETLFQKRCASCHLPPLFTDFQFHNVGIGDPAKDPGRLKQEPDNKARTGAFKTPGLRGAARSAPYFHDGSVATLREAVAFMARGGKDSEFLDPILKTYNAELAPVTEAEIDDLVAFVEALDSKEPFTPPKLP